MPLIGNTIKLRAEFKDFDGIPYDPTDITLTVYDDNRVLVSGPISLGEGNKISNGVYEYDYTIPAGNTNLVYEFKGLIGGKPVLGRSKISRTWVGE